MSGAQQRHGWEPQARAAKPEAPPPPPLEVIQATSFEGLPVPMREWVVDEWLPLAAVTLFYADGGLGKTLLALQLAVALATGTHWCGIKVRRLPVYAMLCEDDAEEVHRRLAAINAVLGVSFRDLELFRFSCPVGADNVLVRFDRDGTPTIQPRLMELMRAAREHGAKLVVIDTAADTFGGNENDRTQVRAYLGAVLTRFARDVGCAVLVCAHPSRTGLSAGGDVDGGSTAWNNTARSRWALVRPGAEEGVEPDETLRTLSRRKSNYAKRGDEIELRWCDGVLQPVRQQVVTGFNAMNRLMQTEAVFLAVLDRCEAQNMYVSTSRNAGNYAPKVFAKRPERDGRTRQDFEAAMNSLLAAERITNRQYGRTGDARFRIMRNEASEQEINE